MGIERNIKDVLREGRQKPKRVELVGPGGVNKQNKRRKAAMEKGPKAVTRDVQKRMGEYRRGNVIDKVKRYKNPLNK
ncbi:MAG: hypothetical protein KOO63_08215 [Bacteroidales bacterium]|nr:hypothetical protein [Candidatus Latescibacterota bacterium]